MPYQPSDDSEYTALNMGMHYMHDWVFHYDIYADVWNAIPRDKYAQYWNKRFVSGILKSKEIETLFDLIHRTHGDDDKIEKLLSNG